MSSPIVVKDAADFGKVAVVMGGTSAERDISINSGGAVLAALLRAGVNAVGLEVAANPLEVLQNAGFDRVFNIVHGRGGEDGEMQGALQSIGLPYTGSGVLGSALSMDKVKTKLCWAGESLPTPPWMVLKAESDLVCCESQLGFPVIVKPALEGSSMGISKVNNSNELAQAWKTAAEHNCEVFAEAWIAGREYTVGFLKDQYLPLIRLETPNAFYDYEAKYCSNSTQYHCPAGLDSDREEELQQLANRACEVVGVTGWGRVDLLIDEEDSPWLIEVNTVPGMTDHSLVPMAAKAAGISFDALVWRILETSITTS